TLTGVGIRADGRVVYCADEQTIRQWDFDLPGKLQFFQSAVPRARAALAQNDRDPVALAVFGHYYELRGMDRWAAEFLNEARSGGETIPALDLARCYWRANMLDDAAREYHRALTEPSADMAYLQLCLRAVLREQKQADWERAHPRLAYSPATRPSPLGPVYNLD